VSLVRRATATALASRCEEVFVVVGAAAREVREELSEMNLELVEARHWERGLSESIRVGIEAVRARQPAFDAAILLPVDQPRLRPELLDALIEAFETKRPPIVACSYAGTVGAPALFSQRHFVDLVALRGDRGAKPLLESRLAEVAEIAFPEGCIDLDTPGDYERFCAGEAEPAKGVSRER
jgi:molybdenum cofactor cytidylyltransferase